MRNRTHILWGAAILAAGFAAGYAVSSFGFANSGSMDHAMDAMTAGIEGKTGDTFDAAFLHEMVVHHQGALDMARAAKERAGHQELKDFAQRIIDAQSAEIAQMQAWEHAWYGGH